MRTTAETIVDTIGLYGPSAVTLYGGYAMNIDGRIMFEPARITGEKRNKSGRCTRLVASYKDGSSILFTWSEAKGALYRALPGELQ